MSLARCPASAKAAVRADRIQTTNCSNILRSYQSALGCGILTVPTQALVERERDSCNSSTLEEDEMRARQIEVSMIATAVSFLSSSALANVAPPGQWGCRDAQAGDTCAMDDAGTDTGPWGVCVQTNECFTWVSCTDPSAADSPDCRVPTMMPGNARVPQACLLCKADAGAPTPSDGSASTTDVAVPAAGGSGSGGAAPASGGSDSGCALVGVSAHPATGVTFLVGLASALLLFRRRR